MGIDYENLQRVVTRYAKVNWSYLKTPVEDLVQETLIGIFEKQDKIKDYDKRHLEGYACYFLRYLALTTLLEEHKNGLWIQQTDCLENGHSWYELNGNTISYLNDPWIDDFYDRKRKREREYYQQHKEEKKAYYHEHREEIIEYQKQYYREHIKDNPEYHKNYFREYYQRNNEKLKNYGREYYQRNNEKLKNYSREYYQRNKEYYKNHNKEYREKNRDKFRNYNRKYYQNNKEQIEQREAELKEKARIIQNEVFEEYGIKLTIQNCKKLVTAKKKSEETYKERLKQMISDSRSF